MSQTDRHAQYHQELELSFDTLSRRIEAAQKDLDAARNNLDRQLLREKYDDLISQRQEVAAKLEALEADADAAAGVSDDEHRRIYLAALRDRFNWVSTLAFMDQAGPEQVGKSNKLDLLGERGVYVPLTFVALDEQRRARDRKGDRKSDKDAPEPPDLALADILARPGHLAIVGAAGSGKTTVLNVLMALLTAEDPAGLDPELAAVLPDPRPLPVFLPLRLFEYACGGENARYRRDQKSLLAFLDDWFQEWCTAAKMLPQRFVAEHVESGRAWLLLDALDEVADEDHRKTVRNMIQNDLTADCRGTRLVVTARVAAYRGAPLDNRFQSFTVRGLNADQRAAMVRKLYAGLALPDAEKQTKDLLDSLEHRDDLSELGSTPVMVWTAAVIHAFRGALPEGRAAVYDAYVDILLKKSFDVQQYDVAALKPLEGQWLLEERRQALCFGAFATHRWLEDPDRRSADGDRTTVVSLTELADKFLADYFPSQLWVSSPAVAQNRAREFVNLMVERSGLLVESPEGFRFGDHLSMQEFLTARYLADHFASDHYYKDKGETLETFVATRYRDTWWRDVFQLAVGYLGTKGGREGADLLRLLARQGSEPADRLAALELAGTACAQLAVLDPPPQWFERIRDELARQLERDLFDKPLDAEPQPRHLAGLALGRLYWDPRTTRTIDPRFAHPYGLPDFVEIPSGPFVMGRDDSDQKDERPAHTVHLDAFAIARYPTTNAMFRLFIDAGGYANPDFWPEAIADGRWANGLFRDYDEKERTGPIFWDDDQRNNPAQPVVGVTWYEAVAYCRWLAAVTGDPFRLPTEAEWEKAAAYDLEHDCVFRYPWGDDWQPGMANTKEAGLGQTCIAGLFSGDLSPAGVCDLAGNVNEWVADQYDESYYARSPAANPRGPEQGVGRVLRGGSWIDAGSDWSRCGCRFWYYPGTTAGSAAGVFVVPESFSPNPCALSVVHCPLQRPDTAGGARNIGLFEAIKPFIWAQ